MKTAACSIYTISMVTILLFGLPVPAADAEIVEFELDEVINAIKQEIETVRTTETLAPRMIIENVEINMAVITREEMNRSTSVKVGGYAGDPATGKVSGARQNVSFVLVPAGESESRKYSKRGLVQAIQKVIFDLRSSLNEPPNYDLNSFTFNLEFGLRKNTDGGISFDLVNLKPLREKGLTHRILIRVVVVP